jgi:ankyrin repeat protein
MAEAIVVIGVITSVLSIVKVASKVGNHLKTLAQASNEAESVAKDLQSKVAHLRICLQNVQRLSRRRKTKEHLDSDEVKIWEGISRTLGRCEALLKEFNDLLEDQASGLRRTLLRHKIERKDPRILVIEGNLDFHLSTLNISIHSLHIVIQLCHHAQTTSTLAKFPKQFIRLFEESLESGKLQLTIHKSKDDHLVSSEQEEVTKSLATVNGNNNESQKRVLRSDLSPEDISMLDTVLAMANTTVARTVHASETESLRRPSIVSTRDTSLRLSTSIGAGMSLGADRTSLISVDSGISEARGMLAGDSGVCLPVDPTPFFNDTAPQKVLEHLIQHLSSQVTNGIEACCYHQAEKHKLELIEAHEDLYLSYDVPPKFEDYQQMQITHKTELAELYEQQGKIDQMESVLLAIFDEVQKPGMIHHLLLARARWKRYMGNESEEAWADAAERDAGRALNCTSEDPETQKQQATDAAMVLVKILEKRNKFSRAKAYRDEYLRRPEDDLSIPSSPVSVKPDTRSSLQCICGSSSRTPPSVNFHNTTEAEPPDLISAVQARRDRQIDYFLKGEDLNLEERRDGMTAVILAVEMGSILVVEKLAEAGAKLEDALFHSVRKGNTDMTRLLLHLGANPETKDDYGATPLLVAASSDHQGVLRALLSYGAITDARNQYGRSPIHCIAQTRSVEMMRTFLDPEYKANKNAVCIDGKTALHYLAETTTVDVATVLLDLGANPEIKDKEKRTPLQIAVNRRTFKFDFVETLLKRGVCVESCDLTKASPEMRNLIKRNRQTTSLKHRNSAGSIKRFFRIKAGLTKPEDHIPENNTLLPEGMVQSETG